jgi:polyphosphate kinase
LGGGDSHAIIFMAEKKYKYINREISWLAFNDRVLQEAEDPHVPLLERIKFLGIFSSNLDEFFRIRVASVRRMATAEAIPPGRILGGKPKKILAQIQETVLAQRDKFEAVYHKILEELADENIFILNEKQLTATQGKFVRNWFQQAVRPTLVPIMIDATIPFPALRDQVIYLIAKLSSSKHKTRPRYAIIELPTYRLPRFLVLPPEGEKNYIILLDDVVRYALDEIFSLFEADTFNAYTIKLTRDAELDLDDDISESYLQKISKSLKQRKKGKLVRFIYDEEMPEDMLRMLTRKLNLRKADNIIPGARYHNFRDFIKFPTIGPSRLLNHQKSPLPHRFLVANNSMLSAIKRRDILLHYPYQSFDYFIDMLREAAIDPQVSSIKITLYRVAQNSNVVNALINAVKNGKMVTAVLELQARFDEENNIKIADRLREEGARVIFGVPHQKVHAKLCLITRKEKGEKKRYAYIGTGNFNENTARLYSDHGLFTADQQIGNDVNQVFTYLENPVKPVTYKHLLVSPVSIRSMLTEHIKREIKNAKAGKPAWMILKMNSLVDQRLIDLLYEAGEAGVKIEMIIRGVCSLKTDVKGVSDTIKVISIIDKYLEHSRIFIFCNGGEEKMYIASADWMSRNLDHRIEVACPVLDKVIQQELKAFLEMQFADNVKARIVDKHQTNPYRRAESEKEIRAQEDFYDLLAEMNRIEDNKRFRRTTQKKVRKTAKALQELVGKIRGGTV